MAEDISQSKDDVFPPALSGDQPGPEDTGLGLCQSSIETLQQRRRKCELKRLLKHTHPEITMLDQVVEKELAAVLSSKTEVAAVETGYEGDVLLKCLIFENCTVSKKGSPYTTNLHMAQKEAEKRGQTPTVLEEPGNQGDPNIEFIDKEIRIDVQSARRMFEKESLKATQSIQHMSQENILDKMKGEIQIRCSTDQQHKEVQHDDTEIFDEDFTSLLEPETLEESIKTSLDLFQHNPFIAANIAKEHLCLQSTTSNIPEGDNSAIVEDYLRANVKNRAHLFESMPFHKIRHQNKDDVETMVENIKETLHFLYSVNVVRSNGSIIEVNETMKAKKAKFTQTEKGPEILYQEVAEGGAQNLILQLLPRANIKPQITYLKEDSKGGVTATVVNAPVYQHQFPTSQDTEFKTANVVQLIEDILNQDNSLRRGVLIQEEVGRCAEVIVYSLYNYLDVEDIKSYSPPPDTAAEFAQSETKTSDNIQTEILELKSGKIESTINCLLETSQNQVFTASMTPDITTKGNVKLFKSCIEKGELEYLKSLNAETEVSDQEIPLNSPEQNIVICHEQKSGDSATEYGPVDIKKLKDLFSTDQKETQLYKNEAAWSNGCRGKNTMKKSQPPKDCQSQEEINFKQHQIQPEECACRFIDPSRSYVPFEDDNRIHQAQLVAVVDECEDMSNLQTAIDNLQKATVEAKSIHDSLQKRQDKLQSNQTPFEEANASVRATDYSTPLKTKEDLSQDNVHQEGMCSMAKWDEQKSDFKCEKTEFQQIQTTGQDMLIDANSERATVQSHGSVTKTQEEDVLHGKLQAAFQALGRSNINVTRGDFRAAMIYRNSRPQKETSVALQQSPFKNTTQETACSEPKSTKSAYGHDVATVGKESTDQSEFILEKNKKPLGPKPAIPPKPEHLKINKMTVHTDTKNDAKQSQQTEDTCSQLIPKTASKPYGNDDQEVKTDKGLVGLGNTAVEIQVPSQATSYNTDAIADKLQGNRVENNVNNNETDESHVNFHEACQKFGGKKTALKKTAPVKPKRVKIAVADTKSQEQADSTTVKAHADIEQTMTFQINSKIKNEGEGKVEMRGKKVRRETEDERRQRLSVHMDEIVRGNTTAAMEIFDNLRKQEELQNILSRVVEIEQDTSEVDVKSLSEVFEDIPEWVVCSAKKKNKKEMVQNKVEKSQLVENKSSVANVFGDLERASEEIIHLKEQTLARLMDIEETIKKALCSVSNLKSESDLAGLSSLFKESLGTAQTSTSAGSISKITIGSSRTKTQDSSTLKTNESQVSSCGVVSAKQQVSPSASPAFISIQSAARKTNVPPEMTLCPSCQHDSKPEETFRTTKTLKCNSPIPIRKEDPRKGGQKQSSGSPLNPKRELSVLEVQTDLKGTSVVSTKTLYEVADHSGNKFYSAKTSTALTTQPQTLSSPPTQTVTSPASFQVSTYPEVRLPINQKP